jgi:hypothetical protein
MVTVEAPSLDAKIYGVMKKISGDGCRPMLA